MTRAEALAAARAYVDALLDAGWTHCAISVDERTGERTGTILVVSSRVGDGVTRSFPFEGAKRCV